MFVDSKYMAKKSILLGCAGIFEQFIMFGVYHIGVCGY
jgi:hypothetical protein